ncbi:UNVERIFIED_CONTAM: hypothetical protein Sangu_2799000 [Sesamum angustifolium]|uniref:Uncharacterized protein n=1 Tax=Sesamum angustifolium TaxID=2727405 RepID=A0AAW2IT71_9LAMI
MRVGGGGRRLEAGERLLEQGGGPFPVQPEAMPRAEAGGGSLPSSRGMPRAGRRLPSRPARGDASSWEGSEALEASPLSSRQRLELRLGGRPPPVQPEAMPRDGRGRSPLSSSRHCLELGGVGGTPISSSSRQRLELVGGSSPFQLEALPRAGGVGRRLPHLFPARGTASSWSGWGRSPSSISRRCLELDWEGSAASSWGGAPSSALLIILFFFLCSVVGYFISFLRFEKVAFTGAGGDLPSYLQGYSPDHIAAIMGLPKCPSHDSLEDLDELYDAEVNNSVTTEPDDRVEEVTPGGEGRGACVEQCESDDEVESEDEETESEGKEVESEVRRLKFPKYWSDQAWSWLWEFMMGRVEASLGLEFPGVVWWILGLAIVFLLGSSLRLFDGLLIGFSIPPHPLLVKIIQSFGICISQLTPNSFMCFEGWRRRFRELGLPVSLASFHALWTVRRVAEVTTSTDDGRYFYFFPQKACRFLDGFTSSKGPWKERFFYVRDDGWGLVSDWSSSHIKISHRRELGRLRQNFMAAGLFSQKIDITHYFPTGKKLEIDAVRARKAAVREQKRLEQELIQPRVGSSVSAAPVGASAGVAVPSPPPTTHTAGPSPPPKRPRGAPSILQGDALTEGVSRSGGGSSYWERTRGVVSEDDLGQIADLSEEQMDELLAENMARALVVTTAARNRRAARLAEMGRLEAALKQQESDFSRVKGERMKH